ncbi:hypothetical protein PIROE2DRAFT_5207 [Piromyces sp. E2]|nr:hypothetical protein PIROE2DRAFT_5207 [Piromyces sp. E2]|eukprot:OUM67347.1 hypothetical protein PIROE2DRAFT_5207 [Piromyces sp. E2]
MLFVKGDIEQEIKTLKEEIVVIDEDNLSPQNTIYYLSQKGSSSSKYFLKDSDENELYQCKFKSFYSEGYFKDFDDKIILTFRLKSHFSGNQDLTIKKGDYSYSTKGIKCIFIPRNSTTNFWKYTVEFPNKITGKTEILDIHFDNKKCFIYFGKQKENGELICKIQHSKSTYKIEIGPNIDQTFMNIIIFMTIYLIQAKRAAASAAIV